MQLLIIRPTCAPVVEDHPATLDTLQGLVGGDIEPIIWPGPQGSYTTGYVNTDGKYDPDVVFNPLATKLLASTMFRDDWVAGTLIVCGFDPDEGENLDVPAAVRDAVLTIGEHDAALIAA